LTDQNQPIITPEGRTGLDRIVGILSRYRVAFFILLLVVLGLLSHSGSGPNDSGSVNLVGFGFLFLYVVPVVLSYRRPCVWPYLLRY
jgi:hypothetical protein